MRVRIQTFDQLLAEHQGPLDINYRTPASGFGRPASLSLIGSLCFHGLAISALLNLRLLEPPPKPKVDLLDYRPITLKVGDKLYFVAELPAPSQRPTPHAPSPPKAATEAPKPQAKAPVVPEAPAPKPAPRVFAPTEVKRNTLSDTTLLQPISPPDLVPPDVPLPTLRVLTGQPRRLARAFIAPGQRKPPPPDPVKAPPPPPPDIVNMAHAVPVQINRASPLILPPTPVLDTTVPKIALATEPPPSPLGDAVDILSISSRPVPPTDRLVVPAGNIIGRTGEGPTLTAGAPGGTGIANGTAAPNRPVNGPVASTPAPAPRSVASSSPLPAGPGTAGALPIAPKSGLTSGSGPGAGVGGTAAPSSADPPGSIRRPANGTFDAVVVQSNAADQSSEIRQLLTGRPIYTVYVSMGTAKDWALNFCIPGEKETPVGGSNVITLSQQAPTPVQAPYPVLLVRPNVTVPAFYKTVLVYGRVTAAGHFENIRVVRPIKPETDQALLTALSKWEFRPASRDGVNVGVEFLLVIPVAGL